MERREAPGACETPCRSLRGSGNAPDERGCDARSRGAASDPTGLRSPLNGRCASRRSTWPANDGPAAKAVAENAAFPFALIRPERHDRADTGECALGINAQKWVCQDARVVRESRGRQDTSAL